jgi:hypothetical protein
MSGFLCTMTSNSPLSKLEHPCDLSEITCRTKLKNLWERGREGRERERGRDTNILVLRGIAANKNGRIIRGGGGGGRETQTYCELCGIIADKSGINGRVIISLYGIFVSRLAKEELESVVVGREELLVLDRGSEITTNQKKKKKSRFPKMGGVEGKRSIIADNDQSKIKTKILKMKSKKRATHVSYMLRCALRSASCCALRCSSCTVCVVRYHVRCVRCVRCVR